MSKSGKKPFYKRWLVWIVVVIAIGIALGTHGSKDKNSDGDTAVNKSESNTKDADNKINYDNFLSIQMGQKYSDVVNLLGEGTESSSSEVAGIKVTIYSWDGDGVSNMNVTIKNDVVIGKAQVGLKSMDADITLDKFNQINNGMTYEQVKEILGEGQVLSQSKMMDTETIVYQYINKGGSNGSFTFSGNTLHSKAQFGLK